MKCCITAFMATDGQSGRRDTLQQRVFGGEEAATLWGKSNQRAMTSIEVECKITEATWPRGEDPSRAL